MNCGRLRDAYLEAVKKKEGASEIVQRILDQARILPNQQNMIDICEKWLKNYHIKQQQTVSDDGLTGERSRQKPTQSQKWNINLDPNSIYLFKLSNGDTRTMGEICSKLIIKTLERRHWGRSGVFVVDFEQISRIVLLLSLLTLGKCIRDEKGLSFSMLTIEILH